MHAVIKLHVQEKVPFKLVSFRLVRLVQWKDFRFHGEMRKQLAVEMLAKPSISLNHLHLLMRCHIQSSAEVLCDGRKAGEDDIRNRLQKNCQIIVIQYSTPSW